MRNYTIFSKLIFFKWVPFLFYFIIFIVIIGYIHQKSYAPESKINIDEQNKIFVLRKSAELPKCKAIIGNSYALIQTPDTNMTYLCRIREETANYVQKNKHCQLGLLSLCNKKISLDAINEIFITTSAPRIRLGYKENEDFKPNFSSLDPRNYRAIYVECYHAYIFYNNKKCEKITFWANAHSKISNPLWVARPMEFLYTPEPHKGEFPKWPIGLSVRLYLNDNSPILEMNNGMMSDPQRCFTANEMNMFDFRMKYDIKYTRVNDFSIKPELTPFIRYKVYSR